MQIMPRDGIAAGFMCGSTSCFSLRPSTSDLLNPDANIAYGARMLAGLVQRIGNVRDALYSYGPVNVGYSYADRVLQIYQSHH
jgi:soluble lytic murein transglycosylase-like protein